MNEDWRPPKLTPRRQAKLEGAHVKVKRIVDQLLLAGGPDTDEEPAVYWRRLTQMQIAVELARLEPEPEWATAAAMGIAGELLRRLLERNQDGSG